MRYEWILIFVLILIPSMLLLGQEDDVPYYQEEEKENKLEWNGNLDVKYKLFNMNQNSSLYKLQFYNELPSSSLLSQYSIEPYLNAEYRTSDLGFILKTHGLYYSDKNSSFDLFEAYASFSPSFNTNLQAGKKVYSWGKGYAFNPVGFVNPFKDPENPELAQAGLLSANIEYVKSFSSESLQSFSLLAVIIPTSGISGTSFGEFKNTDMALKASLLLWDTDIDLLAYFSSINPKRFGIDFSKNLQDNIEIHGELSYNQNVEQNIIADSLLVTELTDHYSFLFGLRYLNESNTTIIAEYYFA